MDRRQRKTREAIFRAFTALLREERCDRITVQQIIDRADIGRTTFYSHFDTKDALLKSLCADIFDHVFSAELDRESAHDFSHDHGTRARITHILCHLQEHLDALNGILSGESGAVFMSFFREKLAELFAPSIPSGTGVPDDYLLNHLVCSFCETVRWWTKHTQYAPEEVSAFFFGTMPGWRENDA